MTGSPPSGAGAGLPGERSENLCGVVQVVELDLVDESRATPAIGDYEGADARPLPTTVYLPAGAGPAPLIVLAHGFDGHPRKFSELATSWAKAGYVVAVPRFPVSNGEFGAGVGGPWFTERVADVGQQSVDIRFVINEVVALSRLPGSLLTDRVDGQRIGLFGLSLGSFTVWNAALDAERAGLRIEALMQSDGAFPGPPERLAAVTFPVFMAQSDAERGPFDPAVVLPQFAAVPTAKYMLVMHGALHATVAENNPVTPADEAYRVATTVFWDRYLGGRADEPFPDTIVVAGITSFVDES